MDERNRELSTADLAGAGSRSDRETRTAVMDRPDDAETGRAPLFSPEDSRRMHERWTSIQAGFVDEPREAVRQADTLVAETIQRLAESFAREKSSLEEQWGRGDDISTEDLRQAFTRYRSFFDRLLSV
jgi:hypothetical protein